MENPSVVLLSSSDELGLDDGDEVQVLEAPSGPVEVIDLCGFPPRADDALPRLSDLPRSEIRADRKARRRGKQKNRRKWHQCFVPHAPLIEHVEEGKLSHGCKIEETAKPSDRHRNPHSRERVPRYFDYPKGFWEMCCNCNENGCLAVNCPTQKRRCYICGGLGHKGKKCKQKYKCSLCQRIGHLYNSCQEKHEGNLASKICVRCGNSGHDMISCRSDYSSEDLKKIRCYVCKNLGHICCVDFKNAAPYQVSCFKCCESGHGGLVCKNVLEDDAG